MVRDVRVLAERAELATRMENTVVAPYGVAGGGAGRTGRITLNPGTPEERVLPALGDAIVLKRGDLLRFETCGGGGWGDPLAREPERVRQDVARGFITARGALEDYGVVHGRGHSRGGQDRDPGRARAARPRSAPDRSRARLRAGRGALAGIPARGGVVMKSIEIDRSKRLIDQPGTGHNRWHPDIPPILEVSEGEEVVLETRDGVDGQLGPATTAASMAAMDAGAIHPITGPVLVKGARPGDLLEIEFVDILPQPHAFTGIVPGLGFLRDLYTVPYLVHWNIADGWATSRELPGVRIPGAPFMGVIGVAPSHAQVAAWAGREQELLSRGGLVMTPDAAGAVPGKGAAATHGLRTIPPRENGGNMDVKQVTKGATLQLPVAVEGALFSVGDGHFAQGDGEVCVTAVEMGATAVVKFKVIRGAGKTLARGPRFRHRDYFAPPEWAAPKRFLAATGMPIRDDGLNEGENLTLACRNALLNMIDLLQERGFTREQAYVISSVAVDLRVSNVVDVPNYVVTALVPEGIFDR